jgi:2-pyrone-4,6-dicarboxylate lactonase
MTNSSNLTVKPNCAPHDPHPVEPSIKLPEGACDCHAHVCGPQDKYDYAENRLYTPPDALLSDFRQMLDALGIQRGVLVQPSIYGFDNRAMLDAIAMDPIRLRGVAALPADVSIAEIERLHSLGVRGTRCNIVDLKDGKGVLPVEYLQTLAEKIKPFDWHIEFLMHVNEFPDLDVQLDKLPVPLVFGHHGYEPAETAGSEGFEALLRLMRDGKAWTKLTGPYRQTMEAFPYAAVRPIAQRLMEAAPQRLLWGTDWPHVHIKTGMPNDGGLLNLFVDWVRSDDLVKQIMVVNPAMLYGF